MGKELKAERREKQLKLTSGTVYEDCLSAFEDVSFVKEVMMIEEL
jgi:hypothetical protein